MKEMTIRIVSLLLALILCVGMTPVESLATENNDLTQSNIMHDDSVYDWEEIGEKLPDGLIAVEYLENIDGAYIDTGIAATVDDKIVLYAAMLSNSNVSMMGSGTTNATDDRVQVHYLKSTGYTLRFFGKMSEEKNLPLSEMISFTLDLQNGVGYINDEVVLEQPAQVLPSHNSIYLFGKNVGGKLDAAYTGSCRIYGYRHYRNDLLLRDMVPCFRTSDAEYGMFDLVEGKFYTNAGEGALYCDTLGLTGGGGIVMNLKTGEIYYGKNIHWKHGMASTTKIMTCILALENLDLDARTVAAVQSDLIGGTTMGLAEGESLVVLDALYGLMLPSGNDAAQLLARTVAGDYESFVAMMNKKAAELGMTETYYTDASGRYDNGLYTTVFDMTILFRYAFQNEIFRLIVSTKDYKIAADSLGAKAHSLKNTNQLLWTYDGVLGGKTGTTGGSGAHLITAAERHGTTLIAMILGSDSNHRFSDVEKMLDYGFAQAPDHVYTVVVTPPTCTDWGYAIYACRCGESYVDDYVDALGHTYSNGICAICGEAQPRLVITGQPEDVSAERFAETAVSVSAEGDGLTYAWYYRCAGETEFRASACTGDSFRTVMSGDLHGCEVYCVITDTAGNSVTSDTAVLTLEGEDAPETPPARIPGDLNGDGEVNNKDLTRLFRFLSGWDVELE